MMVVTASLSSVTGHPGPEAEHRPYIDCSERLDRPRVLVVQKRWPRLGYKLCVDFRDRLDGHQVLAAPRNGNSLSIF